MRTIKVAFVGFWPDFDTQNNYFVQTLSAKYNVVVSSEQPEYIIFSSFGDNYIQLKESSAIKIFYTGENITPDFNICDYALAFDHISFGDRYMRLPLYCLYDEFSTLSLPKIIDPKEVLARKFCSFVYSNAQCAHPARKEFFESLSAYKTVDAGGAMFNNVGGQVPDKLEFIKGYKFNIAFENSAVRGYTTEKIMQPMTVNSVPVYWGNPLVGEDFNPRSFVNAADFASWDELSKYIIHLDGCDKEYLDILNQPWLLNSNYLQWQERLLAFLCNIVDRPYEQAKVLQPYGCTHNYMNRFIKHSTPPSVRKKSKIKYFLNKFRFL